MIFRIIVTIALIVLSIGFLWFVGQIMYLGAKEFFKKNLTAIEHRKSKKTKKS